MLITEATRCLLTEECEELEPRGDFALKGITEPVPIYAVPLDVDGRLREVSKTPQAEA
jgi:class 3 adenylate cyclase